MYVFLFTSKVYVWAEKDLYVKYKIELYSALLLQYISLSKNTSTAKVLLMEEISLPNWATAIIVIFVGIVLTIILYVIFRNRKKGLLIGKKKRTAVGAEQLDNYILEKTLPVLSLSSPDDFPDAIIIRQHDNNPCSTQDNNSTLKGESSRLSTYTTTDKSHQNHNNIYDLYSSSASSTVPTTAPASPYTFHSRLSTNEKNSSVLLSNNSNNDYNTDGSDLQVTTLPSPNATAAQLFMDIKGGDDDASSIWTDDIFYLSSTEPLKISLPLPPSDISFFEDKMELNINSSSVKPTDLLFYQNPKKNIFAKEEDLQEVVISTDTSHNDNDEAFVLTPDTSDNSVKQQPFLLSIIGATNIQQKAANIRTSLYQSLRRKSFTNTSASLHLSNKKSNGIPLSQIFNNDTSNSSVKKNSPTEDSIIGRPSISSTSSRNRSSHPQTSDNHYPSQVITTISEFFMGSNRKPSLVTQTEEEPNSNKIMIDTIPLEENYDLNSSVSPSTKSLQSAILPITDKNNDDLPSTKSSLQMNHSSTSLYKHFSQDLDKSCQTSASISTENTTNDEQEISESEQEDEDLIGMGSISAAAARRVIRTASQKFRKNHGNTNNLATTAGRQRIFGTEKQKDENDKDNEIQKEINLSSILPETATSEKILLPSRREDRFYHAATLIHYDDNDAATASCRSSFSQAVNEYESQDDDNSSKIEDFLGDSLLYLTEGIQSNNNTLRKTGNNIETVRRMLQPSWSGDNLLGSEDESSTRSSMVTSPSFVDEDTIATKSDQSYMGSVRSTASSNYRSGVTVGSPLGSINPRLQNQHLTSLSLMEANNTTSLSRSTTNPSHARPSIMSSGVFFIKSGDDMLVEDEPRPKGSFSSTTARTMIPADEAEEQQRGKGKPQSFGWKKKKQQSSKIDYGVNNKKMQQQNTNMKTPAQKERENYLKSLEN
ncbi:MAG: hypothetical protein EXX96DRAFT_608916 [Benjaminiella poitrasii]|nr:MAG: hypothetical protein EXX96DRAFT_608916 [Benjaminiella poitrasii]